jgi:Flp pilus assembly protein TadG
MMRAALSRLFGPKTARRLAADESAATAAITIVLMLVLLGFLGMVVDAGTLFVERTEMQKAVDAAAMAGAFDYAITNTGACSQTNNATDAQTYFGDNHMSTYSGGGLTEPTTITHNGPPSSPPNLGSGIYCFWQVSAQRSGIPLVFAPLVGPVNGGSTGTVAATAIAYKSPVKGISNPLPYMAWGGNSGIECPTICPDPTEAGEPYDVGQVNSDGTVTYDPAGKLNIEGTAGVYNIELMSNSFVKDVVYPPPPCGGGGRPPCNPNWAMSNSNGLKGFIHLNNSPDYFYQVRTNVATSPGGSTAPIGPGTSECTSATSGQAMGILVAGMACNLSTCPAPTVSSSQIDLYVAAIRGIHLNPSEACSSNSQTLHGWICVSSDPTCNISGGEGGGNDPNAPTVVKLAL